MKLTRIALAWLVAALVAFGTAGTGSTSLVQGNHFSHHFLADDIGPESGLVS